MSSLIANRFPRSVVFNFTWDQSHMDWDQGSVNGVAKSPSPSAAKGSGSQVAVWLLALSGGLLHCSEVLNISLTVYDADCTAGMICSVRHWQCSCHEQDDTLEYKYIDCHMPKWSWPSWVMDSVAIIQLNMLFPSCWNRSRWIWHVLYRVQFCTSANVCGTHVAQSSCSFRSFCKMWNTVDEEVPECVDNSATFQCLSSVKQCSVTATCTSVWADSGRPLRGRSTVAMHPCFKASTLCATVR